MRLQAFLVEQQAKLEAFINSSMSKFSEIAPPKTKFTPRKLPMWGEQVTLEKTAIFGKRHGL